MATAIGFAFAFGVLVLFFQRQSGESAAKTIDVVAILAATFFPLSMLVWQEVYGVLQRGMFSISYLWYAREAIHL